MLGRQERDIGGIILCAERAAEDSDQSVEQDDSAEDHVQDGQDREAPEAVRHQRLQEIETISCKNSKYK